MLIIDTQDSQRRCQRLEEACTHAIEGWQTRVGLLQRQLTQMQSKTKEQQLGKLVEKLLADLADRNAQIEELTKQKQLIESNQGVSVDSEAIAKTQKSLEKMVTQFDKVINDRVGAIR